MDCKSCKDCLHHEACKGTYDTIVETVDTNSFDMERYADTYSCPDFTPTSEWVHLPCKVGDTLYEITSRNTISEYEVTAIRIELFNVFIDWKLTQGFVDRYISDMPVGEIGKTVFLTCEEAEKALEEKK